MPECYICDKELIEKNYYEQNKESFTEKPAINHKEHVIQNGLHGKLKAENILCSDCGGILSTEVDTQFCNLFDVFTVQLKEILVSKDHGNNNNSKILKGYLYTDNSLNEKIDINYKDRCVSPEKPYYEFDIENLKITIFANKNRAKQFQNIVIKKLKEDGVEVEKLEIKINSNIEDNGFLGLHFTEGITDFNAIFKKGLNKIAIGFALHKGLKRIELKNALKINDDKTAEIIYSKNLIPFFPLGAFDRFYEENRLSIEINYPSHELILFSQKYSNGTKKLYCYISLFSTFQYYVLLNDNYGGSDICETYYQTVLKQEIPEINIKQIRPKHLSIIVNEFNIDTSKYKGESLSDYINFIESEYKKLKPNYQFDIFEEIKNSASILTTSFALPKSTDEKQIENMPNSKVIKSFKTIIKEQIMALLMEIKALNNDDFSLYKRAFLEDDGSGQLETLLYPDELIAEMNKDESIFKVYGQMKVQQLSEFIEQNKEKNGIEHAV